MRWFIEDWEGMESISKLWLYSGALFFPALFPIVVVQIIKLFAHPHSSQFWLYPGLLLGVVVGTVCLALIPFRSKGKSIYQLLYIFP